MQLPSYFLADLPAGASLTGPVIEEACRTLRRNRESYLVARPTQSLVERLSTVAAEWLDPQSPFRKLALDQGPEQTGFSRATLERGLDSFFSQITSENLNALMSEELGHPKRLDGWVASEGEERFKRVAIARGPEMVVHIAAGNIPNSTFMSLVLGVLTRSAQVVKCASGASFLPRLFAHSLYAADPKLGACIEVAEWRGGNMALEEPLFSAADCVTVTGTDEALAAVRNRLPARVRFVGYGDRVSFGYAASEALSSFNARKVAALAAADVTAWDQRGCLSPHVIYVENRGKVSPEQFAAMLAEELAAREIAEPRGRVSTETAATIASRRSFYEVRAAHSPDTQMWQSQGSTAWTVVYEASPLFQMSCLHRFIYVKAVEDVTQAIQGADAVRGKVSTVGLAAADHNARRIALEFARWGATRICSLGQMQSPPLAWRHDGRPALGDLVTWSDFETGSNEDAISVKPFTR